MKVRAQCSIACMLVVLALAGCKTELYSNLSESDANVMIALLSQNDMQPTKVTNSRDGTVTIMIEESDFARAVNLLEMNGLPLSTYSTVDVLFAGGGLISSPVEEQARLTYAISQDLSRSISELDGIMSARVHIVRPSDESLRNAGVVEQKSARASVLIRRRANMNLANLVPQLKNFVSNGVDGLEYDDVAVIDFVVEQGDPIIAATPNAQAVPDVRPSQSSAGLIVVGMLIGIVVFALLGIATYFARLWWMRRDGPVQADAALETNEQPAALPERRVVQMSSAEK